MKILRSICLFALFVGSYTLYGQRTIIDNSGKKVAIPTKVNRIADAWPAHNMIVSMLGDGDKIVGTIVNPQMCPWYFKINTGIRKAVPVFANPSSGSLEELMKLKPDIIFIASHGPQIAQMGSLKVPMADLSFFDFKSMRSCVLLTGTLLGQREAAKARLYVNYLDSKINQISNKIKSIPENRKPRVLHISSLSPLAVNGSNSIMDAWIKLAGGRNVAGAIDGNSKQVSAEQILIWNPDIIVFAGAGSSISKNDIMRNPVFSKTNAVKNGRVYQNPKGMFFWDRYSAELALEIQWAAQIFHPDIFRNVNIKAETIRFYKTFFNYNLSLSDANLILQALPPRN